MKTKTSFLILLFLFSATLAAAQDGSSLSSGKRKQKTPAQKTTPKQKNKLKVETSESVPKTKKTPTISPQREKGVLNFVEKNHRELKSVLDHLKKNRPSDYQRALNQINRASQRIENMKQKDPQRYQIELGSWKTQSRIKLVAAKLALNDNDKLRGELKKIIKEDISWRAKRLELDNKRLQERIERNKKSLRDIKSIDNSRLDRLTQNEINKMKPKPRKNKNQKNSNPKKD